jgi:cbb3-type cytochrome oxidase maturation protein
VSVIVLLIAAGGAVALGFLGAFIWAVQTGQFDYTATPPIRILLDDVGSPNSQTVTHSKGMPHVDSHR